MLLLKLPCESCDELIKTTLQLNPILGGTLIQLNLGAGGYFYLQVELRTIGPQKMG